MKNVVHIMVLCLYVSALQGQAARIDSLRLLLEKETQDSNRVLLMEEMSRIYSTSKTDTSLFLAQEALSLSRKIGFERGEAKSLNRIGTVLSSIGNHPQALENLLMALKINEKIMNSDGIMRNQGNIANVNAELGDYREGLNYSFKEKKNAERFSDNERLTNTLLRIGDIYEKLDKLDSARTFTQQAYEQAVKLNTSDNDYYISIALNNLGNIYSKMYLQRPTIYPASIAMGFYRSSLDLYEKNSDNEGISESCMGMSRLFKNTARKDSAIYYAKKSLDAAGDGNFTMYKLDAAQFLADYNEMNKKYENAFYYQKITLAAKDSLFSREKLRRVQTLSFEERERQQHLEEEKIKAKKERSNNTQLALIAGGIVALFFVFLLSNKIKASERWVKVFGQISLLFLFEFVTLLTHPFIEEWTGHTPLLMILILAGFAALLIPAHHHLEGWVKSVAHRLHNRKASLSPKNTAPASDGEKVA